MEKRCEESGDNHDRLKGEFGVRTIQGMIWSKAMGFQTREAAWGWRKSYDKHFWWKHCLYRWLMAHRDTEAGEPSSPLTALCWLTGSMSAAAAGAAVSGGPVSTEIPYDSVAETSNWEAKPHTWRVGELRFITPAGPEELSLQALSPQQRGYEALYTVYDIRL